MKKVSIPHFEKMADVYIKLLDDRYPSAEKILNTAKDLGIEGNIHAKIAIFTQMRDCIRQTAPKLFQSQTHREEFWTAMIEALEDLEDELDELEEEEEKEEEKEKGDKWGEAPEDELDLT